MAKPLAEKKFKLTPRQTEVARLAARGASYKKIAGEVGISPRTVQDHLEIVRRKIGAYTALETVWILSHYSFR